MNRKRRYTNFKDKNGIKIYVGDILRNTGSPESERLNDVIVKFENGYFIPFHIVTDSTKWEVIGMVS